jgi:hypothetical protein
MAFPRWVVPDEEGRGEGRGGATTGKQPEQGPASAADEYPRQRQFWVQETLAAVACGGTVGLHTFNLIDPGA